MERGADGTQSLTALGAPFCHAGLSGTVAYEGTESTTTMPAQKPVMPAIAKPLPR